MLTGTSRSVSNPVKRMRMKYIGDVALVVVRLSHLSAIGSITGPRSVYSQLRGLGKAADSACLKFGGRRIRMLDDGVLLGFGVESRQDDGLRRTFGSPNQHGLDEFALEGRITNDRSPHRMCRSALSAACQMVVQIEQMQVQTGIELPPQAMLHIGAVGVGLIGRFPNSLDCIGIPVDTVLHASESQLVRTGRQHGAVGMTRAFAKVLSVDRPCMGVITVPMVEQAHSSRGASHGAGTSEPLLTDTAQYGLHSHTNVVPVLHCRSSRWGLLEGRQGHFFSGVHSPATDSASLLQLHRWAVSGFGSSLAKRSESGKANRGAAKDIIPSVAPYPAMQMPKSRQAATGEIGSSQVDSAGAEYFVSLRQAVIQEVAKFIWNPGLRILDGTMDIAERLGTSLHSSSCAPCSGLKIALIQQDADPARTVSNASLRGVTMADVLRMKRSASASTHHYFLTTTSRPSEQHLGSVRPHVKVKIS